MAPSKLENQIKEKLNAREIQPSEASWNKLDAMLTASENKKEKKNSFLSFKMIGIAATLLLFFTIGFNYSSKNETVKPTENSIANQTITKDSIQKNQENSIEEKSNNSIIPNKSTQHFAQTQNPKPATRNFTPATRKSQPESLHPQPVTNIEIVQEIPKEKELIIEKVNTNKITVNPNALLASVETKRANNVIPNKIKVDANIMLGKVDNELELTFREKVIKKITKNYKEVKVAIATRNQE